MTDTRVTVLDPGARLGVPAVASNGAPTAIRSQAAREFARAAKSANTQRAYRWAWEVWQEFCRELSYIPLPASPEAVVEFLTWCSDQYKVASIELMLAGVSYAHRLARAQDPTDDEDVRLVLTGLRRTLHTAQRRVAPVLNTDLVQIVPAMPTTLTGIRDKAMVLVCFACALRRSELVALRVDDVEFSTSPPLNGMKGIVLGGDAGNSGCEMTVTLRQRKTDQEGRGTRIIVPWVPGTLCAITALRHWMDEAKITDGPLFRKVDRWGKVWKTGLLPGSVPAVVKRAVALVGLDGRKYSGHSMRAGFVTSAADQGEPINEIMAVTGHTSDAVYAYIRDNGRSGRRAISTVLSGGHASAVGRG